MAFTTDTEEKTASSAQAALTSLLAKGVALAPVGVSEARTSEAIAGHVTEFEAGIKPIGDAQVTTQAQQILQVDPEATVWQESPSLALLIWPAFKWLLVLLVAFFVVIANESSIEKKAGSRPSKDELALLNSPLPEVAKPLVTKGKQKPKLDNASKELMQQRANVVAKVKAWDGQSKYEIGMNLVLFAAFASLLLKLAELKGTCYTMSSQRLVIETGVISKSSWPVELHQLGNALIHKPLTLRLFGVSNLHVSGLMLKGLRNAELVRDLLRNAGQIQAQRTEKIRWR